MFLSQRAVPRWLAAIAIGALVLSLFVSFVPGRAGAQDDASATPTAADTSTASDTGNTAQEASTDEFAVDDIVVVADGPLNVRADAGTDAEVKFQFGTGDRAEISDGPVDDGDYTWYELKTVSGAATGWVASDFLELATAPDFSTGDVVTATDGNVNVREDSTLASEVVTKLAAGDTATVLDGPVVADTYTWYEIEIDSSTSGWAAGEFLEVASTDDAGAAFAEDDEVVVVDGPLNVREDATTEADVLVQLEDGDTATIVSGPVTADGYDWYEVGIDTDTSGWIAGEFVALAGSEEVTEFAVGDAVRVAVDGINFRADPGLDGDVLDTLDIDALFLVQDGPVDADGYTWYQVFNYYYGTGWVAGKLLTLEPDGFPAES